MLFSWNHVLHDSAPLWLTLYNIGGWYLNVFCWYCWQINKAIWSLSFKQIEFWLTSYLVNRTIGQTVKSNTSLSSSVAVYSLIRKAVLALSSCKEPTHFSVRPISTQNIEGHLINALWNIKLPPAGIHDDSISLYSLYLLLLLNKHSWTDKCITFNTYNCLSIQ